MKKYEERTDLCFLEGVPSGRNAGEEGGSLVWSTQHVTGLLLGLGNQADALHISRD